MQASQNIKIAITNYVRGTSRDVVFDASNQLIPPLMCSIENEDRESDAIRHAINLFLQKTDEDIPKPGTLDSQGFIVGTFTPGLRSPFSRLFLTVELLLNKKGADPDVGFEQRNTTALFDMVSLLVEFEQRNTTALFDMVSFLVEVEKNHAHKMKIAIIKTLINKGADVNKVCGKEQKATPILLAFSKKNDEAIKLLIPHFNPKKYSKEMMEELYKAVFIYEFQKILQISSEISSEISIDKFPFTKQLIEKGMRFKTFDLEDETNKEITDNIMDQITGFMGKQDRIRHRRNFILSAIAGITLVYPLIITILYLWKALSFKPKKNDPTSSVNAAPAIPEKTPQADMEGTLIENLIENGHIVLEQNSLTFGYSSFSMFYETKLGLPHTAEEEEAAIPSEEGRKVLLGR